MARVEGNVEMVCGGQVSRHGSEALETMANHSWTGPPCPKMMSDMKRRGPYELLKVVSDRHPFRVSRGRRGGLGGPYRTDGGQLLVREALLDPGVFSDTWLDEDGALAKLPQHPGIERVVECKRGEPWWAEELVLGCKLSRGLERHGPLPVSVACAVAHALSEALSYLHKLRAPSGEPLQWVHRSVSVETVVLSEAGSVLLANPVFANLERGASAGRTSPPSTATLLRLSREQLRGEPIGQSSDLYQLGVTLFEMLVGRPVMEVPAEGDFAGIVRADRGVPPSRGADGIPAALDALVLRLLTPEPAARPPSAVAVAGELEAVRVAEGWPAWSAELDRASRLDAFSPMTPLGL